MSKNPGRRIFLDCGLYDGVAIKQYVFDDSWDIYSFEPNNTLAIDNVLARLPKVTLIRAAVWTSNGVVDFVTSGREDAAHIVNTTGHPAVKEMKVPSVDFSEFVSQLPKAQIVCSMDIEGAEFVVLEKMLKDHTVDKFSVLDVEFHHRAMNDYNDNDARDLIKRIEARGVIVRVKVVLND